VLKTASEDRQILRTQVRVNPTHQPATDRVVPAAGSDPDAGRTAYEMVELVGMEVESFKIARSPL
jgi:hypothetical protein